MELSQELERAKNELHIQREKEYRNAYDGINVYEVSPGKTVSLAGGINTFIVIESGYKSMFEDSDTPPASAKIQQYDKTTVDCTKAEWETLVKAMRARGSQYTYKNIGLTDAINDLATSASFETIWNTTWENFSS